MKKVLLLLLIVSAFLYSCENNIEISDVNDNGISGEISNINNDEISDINEINFLIKASADTEDWDQVEFPVDLIEIDFSANANKIITKEDAIKFGEIILKTQQKNNYYLDYELRKIVHYSKENIWYFNYSLKQFIPGSCLSIVIDGNNCDIIKAWVGE